MGSWLKRALIAVGGFLLLIGLVILGRDGRALARTQERRERELEQDEGAALGRAEKLNAQAVKHRDNARLAAAKTQEILDARSEKDQSMGDLLSGWESRRVRDKRPG